MENAGVVVTGYFTREQLQQLLWPIAWQGTVSQARREEYESALRALVEEATAALDQACDSIEVEINGGVVVSVIVDRDHAGTVRP